MSSSARKQRRGDKSKTYDPDRKWGLKPDPRDADGQATYVVGGFIASSGPGPGPGPSYINNNKSGSASGMSLGDVGEKMGREVQARAKRKDGKKEERDLLGLLERRGGGGGAGGRIVDEECLLKREAAEAVRIAREVMREKESFGKRKAKGKAGDEDENQQGMEKEEEEEEGYTRVKSYSASMVKNLGFNPTFTAYGSRKSGARTGSSSTGLLSKVSLDFLPLLYLILSRGRLTFVSISFYLVFVSFYFLVEKKIGSTSRQNIKLGPPPGTKVRSGVAAPASNAKAGVGATTGNDSSSDLEIEPPSASVPATNTATRKAAQNDGDSDSDFEFRDE
jgi:minichromosome maintenance protein 10